MPRARGRVCYVLERESHTDLAVLDNACAQLHLPRPERRVAAAIGRAGAYIELVRRTARFGGRRRSGPRATWLQLVEAAAANPGFDVDLVPVAIFWGRAPLKEESLWRLLFTEDWVLVGALSQAAQRAIQRPQYRRVLRRADRAARGAARTCPRSAACAALLRALRAELRAQRASTIGPDLSHRRTMVAHILRTQAVRHAVRARDAGARRTLARAEHAG